jgi:hypothetical protein
MGSVHWGRNVKTARGEWVQAPLCNAGGGEGGSLTQEREKLTCSRCLAQVGAYLARLKIGREQRALDSQLGLSGQGDPYRHRANSGTK